MKIIALPFKGAYIITTTPFKDLRGQFTRIFCKRDFRDIKHNMDIAQINHSITFSKGAVRGMHFQYPPKAEAKIIKCLRGSVFDVIIDLRYNLSTFLKWHGEILSAKNMKMVFMPEGFAHGFQVLEEDSELLYLHTEFYNPEYEGGIRFDDPRINISWPLKVGEISRKDRSYPLLDNQFSGIRFGD